VYSYIACVISVSLSRTVRVDPLPEFYIAECGLYHRSRGSTSTPTETGPRWTVAVGVVFDARWGNRTCSFDRSRALGRNARPYIRRPTVHREHSRRSAIRSGDRFPRPANLDDRRKQQPVRRSGGRTHSRLPGDDRSQFSRYHRRPLPGISDHGGCPLGTDSVPGVRGVRPAVLAGRPGDRDDRRACRRRSRQDRHEVRNEMTAVRGLGDLLQEDDPDDLTTIGRRSTRRQTLCRRSARKQSSWANCSTARGRSRRSRSTLSSNKSSRHSSDSTPKRRSEPTSPSVKWRPIRQSSNSFWKRSPRMQ